MLERAPELPEEYPELPEEYPELPEEYPELPEVYPELPELYPELPELYPAELPELYPAELYPPLLDCALYPSFKVVSTLLASYWTWYSGVCTFTAKDLPSPNTSLRDPDETDPLDDAPLYEEPLPEL